MKTDDEKGSEEERRGFRQRLPVGGWPESGASSGRVDAIESVLSLLGEEVRLEDQWK